jgi:hypothetical protein
MSQEPIPVFSRESAKRGYGLWHVQSWARPPKDATHFINYRRGEFAALSTLDLDSECDGDEAR